MNTSVSPPCILFEDNLADVCVGGGIASRGASSVEHDAILHNSSANV